MPGENKIAIFNYRHLSKPSILTKLLKAFFLTALFAGAAFSQGSESSVVMYNKTPEGTEARAVSEYLAGKIGEGLQNQYPCIDTFSDESMNAALDWERKRQLLGEEPNEQLLSNIADALGARYIVIVSSATLPNGQTSVMAKVVDTRTVPAAANRMEIAENAEAALTTAEKIAKNLMQDLSSVFRNRCEPHWSGTITYTRLKEVSKTESITNSPNSQMTIKKVVSVRLTADILLQPMTLGFSGDTTYARVSQNYTSHDERIIDESAAATCREPGRNPFRKQVYGDEKEYRDESGQNTQNVSVNISVYQGNYRIKVFRIEHFPTKGTFERKGNIIGCKPNPFSSTQDTEGIAGVGYINLDGQVDPRNADILTGKKTEGDLENGQETWKWTLRYVNPNRKK